MSCVRQIPWCASQHRALPQECVHKCRLLLAREDGRTEAHAELTELIERCHDVREAVSRCHVNVLHSGFCTDRGKLQYSSRRTCARSG